MPEIARVANVPDAVVAERDDALARTAFVAGVVDHDRGPLCIRLLLQRLKRGLQIGEVVVERNRDADARRHVRFACSTERLEDGEIFGGDQIDPEVPVDELQLSFRDTSAKIGRTQQLADRLGNRLWLGVLDDA